MFSLIVESNILIILGIKHKTNNKYLYILFKDYRGRTETISYQVYLPSIQPTRLDLCYPHQQAYCYKQTKTNNK